MFQKVRKRKSKTKQPVCLAMTICQVVFFLGAFLHHAKNVRDHLRLLKINYTGGG